MSNDAITAGASPRPWKVVKRRIAHFDIDDANGSHIATIYDVFMDSDGSANAALIVEAANAYGSLRDLVRRLARVASDTLGFAEAMNGIIEATPERIKAQNEIRVLLRETSEALGEEGAK